MLSEEHKAKIQAAIEALNKIIESLEGSSTDPRAVQLLDIAASYLEEQHEQGIEYKEEPLDEDGIDLISFEDPHDGAYTSQSMEVSDEFKFFTDDAIEAKKVSGDDIAQAIQAWYHELDNQNTEDN
jgi:hypothetical protein